MQAVDVYAFGVLLWEMLTSSRAWAGLRHAHVICMVGVQKQTLAIPEGLHPVLGSLLTQCMARNPDDRPTFRSIAETLSHFVQVTRVTDPADLVSQASTAAVCRCDGGAGCCSVCRHASDCAEASCLRCKLSPPASSCTSEANGTASMLDFDEEASQELPSQVTANISGVEEAIASAGVDQAKPAHSPLQSGKGVKRTSESLQI